MGYVGYSMSENAVEAYDNGEMPMSSWRKKDILCAIEEAIENEELELQCNYEKLKKAPVKVLKNVCLECTSWHHTSKFYNETDFYSLDLYAIEGLTDEDLEEYIEEYREEQREKKKNKPKEEKARCSFLEWYGTRRHRRSREIIEEGIIKGDWFYKKDGHKKWIYSNGFRILEKL